MVLNPNTLFCHLISDNDLGIQSPNPNTKYLLSDIGVSNFPNSALEKTGYFFNWAQLLGGMEFPSIQLKSETDDSDALKLEQATNVDEKICIDKVHNTI